MSSAAPHIRSLHLGTPWADRPLVRLAMGNPGPLFPIRLTRGGEKVTIRTDAFDLGGIWRVVGLQVESNPGPTLASDIEDVFAIQAIVTRGLPDNLLAGYFVPISRLDGSALSLGCHSVLSPVPHRHFEVELIAMGAGQEVNLVAWAVVVREPDQEELLQEQAGRTVYCASCATPAVSSVGRTRYRRGNRSVEVNAVKYRCPRCPGRYEFVGLDTGKTGEKIAEHSWRLKYGEEMPTSRRGKKTVLCASVPLREIQGRTS